MLFSIVKRGYFCGFYFWLDVIATLSLFFDIPAFVALFNPVGAGQTSGQGGTLARAGRSANAGSKMGRILRLVRVIQLLRRIYKYEQRMREARRLSQQGNSDAYSTMRKLEHPRNARVTRVGAKLSDLTTRCVHASMPWLLGSRTAQLTPRCAAGASSWACSSSSASRPSSTCASSPPETSTASRYVDQRPTDQHAPFFAFCAR